MNSSLNQKIALDESIGELQHDEIGCFRMVDGRKIYQIKEESDSDKDTNLIINRCRVSGMSPSEYLKYSCH